MDNIHHTRILMECPGCGDWVAGMSINRKTQERERELLELLALTLEALEDIDSMEPIELFNLEEKIRKTVGR